MKFHRDEIGKRVGTLLLSLIASASLLACSSSLMRVPCRRRRSAYASAVAPPPQESGTIRAWGDERRLGLRRS